ANGARTFEKIFPDFVNCILCRCDRPVRRENHRVLRIIRNGFIDVLGSGNLGPLRIKSTKVQFGGGVRILGKRGPNKRKWKQGGKGKELSYVHAAIRVWILVFRQGFLSLN